jgi:hypothetical protein
MKWVATWLRPQTGSNEVKTNAKNFGMNAGRLLTRWEAGLLKNFLNDPVMLTLVPYFLPKQARHHIHSSESHSGNLREAPRLAVAVVSIQVMLAISGPNCFSHQSCPSLQGLSQESFFEGEKRSPHPRRSRKSQGATQDLTFARVHYPKILGRYMPIYSCHMKRAQTSVVDLVCVQEHNVVGLRQF